MVRRVHVVVITFLIVGELYYLYSGTQTESVEAHWTVIPFLDIKYNSTHVLHGERVPLLLNTQQTHGLRQQSRARAGSSVAQAAASVVSHVAGAIAATLPQWPSINATMQSEEATSSLDAAAEMIATPEPSLNEGDMQLSSEEGGSDNVTGLPALEDSAVEETPTPTPVGEEKTEKEQEKTDKEQEEVEKEQEKEKKEKEKEKKGNVRGQETRKAKANVAGKVPLPAAFTAEEREDYLTHLHAQHGKEFGLDTNNGKLNGMITIIMMGYSEDRRDNYRRLLSKYRSMCNVVDKVILIWNNHNAKAPRVPDPRPGTSCLIPVVVLLSKRNSLNNRFLVSHLVKTEAVFTVDDDFLFSQSLLRCLLRHWERDKDRIVGLHPRLVEKSGNYNPYYVNGYNLILTGSALFHVRFLDLYAKNLEVQEKVDSIMSGEDILFNAVSQNATRKPPLFVVPYENFRFKEFKKSSTSGLHSRYTWKQWLAERSRIATWALEHFPKDVFRMETKKGLCRGRTSNKQPKH